MRRGLGGAVLALGLAISLPTSVGARAIYFHKSGVDDETFVVEAQECEGLAAGVQAPSVYQPQSASLYAAGASAFLAGFMRSRERRGMVDNVLRTCMADKGYRRIEAARDAEDQIDRLSGTERLSRLASLAAAGEPQGKMLPR